MAAAANFPSLNVVYRPQLGGPIRTSIHPLLELSLAQTNSQGAYLYRLDRERAAWNWSPGAALAASDIESFDVELRPEAAAWHRENLTDDLSRSRCLVGLALRALSRVPAQSLPGGGLRPVAGSRRTGGHRQYRASRADCLQPREGHSCAV